eukprot:CAMPEP_0117684252 /NCGR_PEP_ID=MMETSP0804-20121206/20968_1 /TAXON_ID=1074897 /ORGANISM="Tetraselmis astigmatica, Strain CCMP880" /LENGTH=680 /DNA_ID=CAMNT_0005495167 /DNA_START=198 /DNA_END=2240 /DNA_ORIENTATION=-
MALVATVRRLHALKGRLSLAVTEAASMPQQACGCAADSASAATQIGCRVFSSASAGAPGWRDALSRSGWRIGAHGAARPPMYSASGMLPGRAQQWVWKQVLHSSPTRSPAAQLPRTPLSKPARPAMGGAPPLGFASAFQMRCAATVATLRSSGTGRRLLLLCVPLALAGALSTGVPFHMQRLTPPAPPPPPALPPDNLHSFRSSPARFLLTELQMLARSLYLLALFAPLVMLSPICLRLEVAREQWIALFCWTLERAGPAFMKWGQWAATRPDMFPPDLCQTLEKLQSNAPCHPASRSIGAVEESFGCPIEEIFEEFDRRPIASGSIAQVHRAVLSEGGAEGTGLKRGTTVAVKVRHPGVDHTMSTDFLIMTRLVALLGAFPGVAGLRLEESVQQFGAPLREQLNLSHEAANLARFNHNFRNWSNVSFPRPVFPLVSESVLVESFEEGVLISNLVKSPDGRESVYVAMAGMQSYLKMLLKDNFVHADLHPGNILVKPAEERRRGAVGDWLSAAAEALLGVAPSLPKPHVVLLDVGMVAEMTNIDKMAMTDFFRALCTLNGTAVAESIMRFSKDTPSPAASHGFTAAMEEIFGELDEAKMRQHTQQVIADMLEAIRQYGVSLRGTVSTLMVTTMILEGWSTKLHPDIRIMDSVRDLLPGDWKQRLSRAVDTVMSAGELAVT